MKAARGRQHRAPSPSATDWMGAEETGDRGSGELPASESKRRRRRRHGWGRWNAANKRSKKSEALSVTGWRGQCQEAERASTGASDSLNKDEGPISLARTRREESSRATRQTQKTGVACGEPLPSAPCWPRRWRRGRRGTILKKSARRLPQPREAKG